MGTRDRRLTALGGGGGAAAYLLGRLGHRVRLNTRVGADFFGSELRRWFGEAGVKLVGAEAETTAVNVIQLSPEGERRSVYYTGEKVAWERSPGDEEAG